MIQVPKLANMIKYVFATSSQQDYSIENFQALFNSANKSLQLFMEIVVKD